MCCLMSSVIYKQIFFLQTLPWTLYRDLPHVKLPCHMWTCMHTAPQISSKFIKHFIKNNIFILPNLFFHKTYKHIQGRILHPWHFTPKPVTPAVFTTGTFWISGLLKPSVVYRKIRREDPLLAKKFMQLTYTLCDNEVVAFGDTHFWG